MWVEVAGAYVPDFFSQKEYSRAASRGQPWSTQPAFCSIAIFHLLVLQAPVIHKSWSQSVAAGINAINISFHQKDSCRIVLRGRHDQQFSRSMHRVQDGICQHDQSSGGMSFIGRSSFSPSIHASTPLWPSNCRSCSYSSIVWKVSFANFTIRTIELYTVLIRSNRCFIEISTRARFASWSLVSTSCCLVVGFCLGVVGVAANRSGVSGTSMLAAADDAATEETIGAEGCPGTMAGWPSSGTSSSNIIEDSNLIGIFGFVSLVLQFWLHILGWLLVISVISVSSLTSSMCFNLTASASSSKKALVSISPTGQLKFADKAPFWVLVGTMIYNAPTKSSFLFPKPATEVHVKWLVSPPNCKPTLSVLKRRQIPAIHGSSSSCSSRARANTL